jgi:hypothetical protein
MGIFNLTESERNEILSLHNNAKVLKEQTTPEAPAASIPQDRKSKIMQLQTILKTKYNADLGATGPNKDGIDGNLGAKTLGALSTIMKSKGTAAAATTGTATPAAPAATTTGTATPAATTGTATPAAPAATTGTATPAAPAATTGTATPAAPVASQSPDEVMGTEVPAQQQLNQASQQALGGQLTPQQIRQQSRFDQRLARQSIRTARRAGQ